MMNKLSLTICSALLVLATRASAQPAADGDKIATLVSTLAKQQLWMNGLTPHIGLDRDALPAQVLERYFAVRFYDGAPLKEYTIIAIREVLIPPDDNNSPTMSAVLVESTLGPKIVLMRFEGSGWWTRAFDVK
ncbi:hypothetical protein [Massilia aquatica]|uniref:Uncharacterized protein n=1 Tax=Massilia aquatica TaxID=2609000 RepID=A0ABX0M713_9BURK|nr:hypothetical protein [Massilia aquatica]NHZ40833.1 hypothetical protein [Massilia aquatica]